MALKLKHTNYFKKLKIKASENLIKRVNNGASQINMDYQILSAFHDKKIKQQIKNKKKLQHLNCNPLFFR